MHRLTVERITRIMPDELRVCIPQLIDDLIRQLNAE
jgi:hypothetical protein